MIAHVLILRRQAGFALVEAIVAFAILAISLIALFVGVSGAERSGLRSHFQMTALRLARSRLDELGVVVPLRTRTYKGRSEGVDWTVTVSPYGVSAANASHKNALHAYWAQIILHPRGSHHPIFRLTTLKLTARLSGKTS